MKQIIEIKVERKLDETEIEALSEMTADEIKQDIERMKQETVDYFEGEGDIPKEHIKLLRIELVEDDK